MDKAKMDRAESPVRQEPSSSIDYKEVLKKYNTSKKRSSPPMSKDKTNVKKVKKTKNHKDEHTKGLS